MGRSDKGELSISAYALLRYMNQMPSDQTWTDHNGTVRDVKARHDWYSHRILVWLKGWLVSQKFRYTITFWTTNTVDQDAIFANLSYQFHKRFNLNGGISGNNGSRSVMGSHPYWLGHDRVMADEFFRAFFTMGIWANGELFPGFYYNVMVGNSNSILGVKATELDRKFSLGGTLWWMPTTKEFGPRGGYGDFAYHEKVATRFGISANTSAPSQRFAPVGSPSRNTGMKLADGLNAFATDALAPGVTVEELDYTILAFDAGMKYKGFFLQAEYYNRTLDNFMADGPLPVSKVNDHGFYVQAAFFPIKKKLEVYGATSQIFGDKDAGFDDCSEWILGGNWYFGDTRDVRMNLQLIDVDKSPVGSTFGYYTTGQKGQTVSWATSILF